MKLPSAPKILIAPDSFKGTMTSLQAAEAIARGLAQALPSAHLTLLPLADGGEGSAEIAASVVGGTPNEAHVFGPDGAVLSARYFETSNTAYIDIAAAGGLPLARKKESSVVSRTSYGTGQLIVQAIADGKKTIYLFLGGSATTDGGVGIAKALGFAFYRADGTKIDSISDAQLKQQEFTGDELSLIAQIKPPEKNIGEVSFIGVTDVGNPLYGPDGAAMVYGPQKGASLSEVQILEQGLLNLASRVTQSFGTDFSAIPGAGAAGGAGYGVLAFLGGTLVHGPRYLLDLMKFNEQARDADVIITGEGRLDRQSFQGKLLAEMLERTKALGKPLFSFSGSLALEQDFALPEHFTAFAPRSSATSEVPEKILEHLARQVGEKLSDER